VPYQVKCLFLAAAAVEKKLFLAAAVVEKKLFLAAAAVVEKKLFLAAAAAVVEKKHGSCFRGALPAGLPDAQRSAQAHPRNCQEKL